MKSFILAALIGMVAIASVVQAEPGGIYGRFKAYDIGNPGHLAANTDCMNMPCCKNMKAEDMADCPDMPCCKNAMEQGACKKMLKPKKV